MADLLASLDDGAELADLLRRFYPLVIEQAFGDASDTLGLDISFDLSNPRVQDVIDQLAERVKDVADTTKQQIRDLVAQATEDGWGADELADAIRAAGITESATRSQAIARTETADAYTRGALLAYGDSGVVESVEWLLGPDPCPDCQPYGGQRAALGTMFEGGAMPPLHPNCTCAISPVLKGAD